MRDTVAGGFLRIITPLTASRLQAYCLVYFIAVSNKGRLAVFPPCCPLNDRILLANFLGRECTSVSSRRAELRRAGRHWGERGSPFAALSGNSPTDEPRAGAHHHGEEMLRPA